MKPYIGIGTIIKDHSGYTGKVIGYDTENKIVTVRYAEQRVTKVRTLDDIIKNLASVSYREVE